MSVTTLLALTLLQAGSVQDDWSAVWERLGGLRAKPEEAWAGTVARELYALAESRADDPRALLLTVQLNAVTNGPAGDGPARLARLPLEAFTGRATWLVAEVLPPGPERVAAIQAALEATPELSRDDLLLAWNVAVDEARGLRLAQGALPIQEVLHGRYQATWSAIDLALTRTLLGDVPGADAILAQAIAHEEEAGRPSAELWNRRGIAALGIGDEARARDYLGQALARGSEDAGLVLGRLDLDAGRLEAARKGFRASILSDRPSAWALRGWGLTLLPEPLEAKNAQAERRPALRNDG